MLLNKIDRLNIDKEIMLEKLLQLRERIEAWCAENSYDRMDNRYETRNKDGEIVWFQSDWEYVDDFHNGLINNDDWHYNVKTLRKLNQMWRRYKTNLIIVKPSQ